MRITEKQKLANRRKIVETATRLFQERGFDGVGIADIMERAGFTQGGFYNHFQSKDELAEAALRRGFEAIEDKTRGLDLTSMLNRYMSRDHRDDVGEGCPVPALGGDAARQALPAKEAFADGVEMWLSLLGEAITRETKLAAPAARKQAINHLAKAVGAVVLSRACPPERNLKDEILRACTGIKDRRLPRARNSKSF